MRKCFRSRNMKVFRLFVTQQKATSFKTGRFELSFGHHVRANPKTPYLPKCIFPRDTDTVPLKSPRHGKRH